jgi:hypothetical protein
METDSLVDKCRGHKFQPILPVGRLSVEPRPTTCEPNPMNPGEPVWPDPSMVKSGAIFGGSSGFLGKTRNPEPLEPVRPMTRWTREETRFSMCVFRRLLVWFLATASGVFQCSCWGKSPRYKSYNFVDCLIIVELGFVDLFWVFYSWLDYCGSILFGSIVDGYSDLGFVELSCVLVMPCFDCVLPCWWLCPLFWQCLCLLVGSILTSVPVWVICWWTPCFIWSSRLGM